MDIDDEALHLAVLKRRLAGTVGDALKSDAEIAAEIRGERLAAADLRGRARVLGGAAPAASPKRSPPIPNPKPRPVSAPEAQDAAIMELLARLGFDPMALPSPSRPGAVSSAKQAVRDHLGYSEDVVLHAWKRLKRDGRIRYAE